MKWIAIPVIAIVVGLIVFVMNLPERTPEIDTPLEGRPVRTVTVGRSAIELARTFTGNVAVPVELPLGFRVRGKIVELTDEIGAHFDKGDILARLDDRDYELQLQAAEAKVDALEIRIKQLERDRKRSAELLKENVISEQRHEQLLTELRSARKERQSAEDQVALAKRRLRYCKLKAPFRGTVGKVQAEVGEVVPAGKPVLTLLSHERWEFVADVPEDFVPRLESGKEATITLDAYPDEPLSGTVSEVATSAARLSTYPVRLTLENNESVELREGLLGSLRFKTDEEAGVLLPLNAVVARNGESFVWIVDEETAEVHQRSVSTGKVVGERVQVSGLNEGDRVVVRGVHRLHKEMKVSFSEKAED